MPLRQIFWCHSLKSASCGLISLPWFTAKSPHWSTRTHSSMLRSMMYIQQPKFPCKTQIWVCYLLGWRQAPYLAHRPCTPHSRLHALASVGALSSLCLLPPNSLCGALCLHHRLLLCFSFHSWADISSEEPFPTSPNRPNSHPVRT